MTHQLWLTEGADVRCTHQLGRAPQRGSQDWVRIDGVPVLVVPDPIGRPISGCPNIGVSLKPCTTTLAIMGGQSVFVRIEGQPIVRADLRGLTDGTPPGEVEYRPVDADQTLVGELP